MNNNYNEQQIVPLILASTLRINPIHGKFKNIKITNNVNEFLVAQYYEIANITNNI